MARSAESMVAVMRAALCSAALYQLPCDFGGPTQW
jgi:hypothetical protein